MSSFSLTPRLRMFAGPNGSGKSTIKSKVEEYSLGVFVNPDEIEVEIKNVSFLDFEKFGINPNKAKVLDFFQCSEFLKKQNLSSEVAKLSFEKNKLHFNSIQINSYFASVTADFIRQKLMEEKQSFSFETVMSSPDKVEFLQKAHFAGYRNYLYFVATEDPQINISRVEVRVKAGGHNVPKDKIESRYYRSMDFLSEVIKYTSRAYIFDNSGEKATLCMEITNGEIYETKSYRIPLWVKKYVLDKLNDNS
jgi:predicted ABC-type ATPase